MPYYISICPLKKPAADCANFSSVSFIFFFSSFDIKTTLPITSPCDIIGYITCALNFLSWLSFFIIGNAMSLFLLLRYISLSSNNSSNSFDISFSKNSFLETPDTAITLSLSVIHAICPLVLARVSA